MKNKLFVFLFVLPFIVPVFSQENFSKVKIMRFDEEGCRADAKKAGILESELDGYINYKKFYYYSTKQSHISQLKIVSPIVQNTIVASPCDNTDFEQQNFNSWTADTGSINSITDVATYASGFSNIGNNASLFNPLARHTIFNIKPSFNILPVPPPYTGYDERLDFKDLTMPIDSAITYVAPNGGNISVRLGNAVAGGKTERLKKTFIVDANSSAFTYSFAAILQNPGAHSSLEQSRFTFRLLDSNNSLIPGSCSFYEVYGGKDSTHIIFNDTICQTSISGTTTCSFTIFDFINWTTVGVDLSPYIGQQITVEFTTRDCSLAGHFGYAYVDAKCSPFEIKTNFCIGGGKIILTAPDGYVNYQWKDPTNSNFSNNQEVELNNPKIGDEYTVLLTSVTGCTSTLKSKIANCGTGIYESDNNLNFSIYPNPAITDITIETLTNKPYTSELFNILGELVYTSKQVLTGKTIIDVSSFPKGIYVIHLRDLHFGAVNKQRIAIQ